MERENEMIKREKYLTEMEQTILGKMDKLEKEHIKKERTLHLKEQEFTSYMKETQKKMNDKIDKLETWYQRKEREIKEKELAIEKMKDEGREKLEHKPERTDTKKKSVRIDTDTDTEDDTDHIEESDRRRQRANKGLDNLNLKLNLTPFSGMEPVPRNEATFEEWKLEVECVKAIYSELVVIQAIRKALKGQAKRIMLHLGPYASVEKIEKKLEDAFGNIASKDSILSHFFLAEQEVNESIVEWGLRLEDMLLQASRKTRIEEKEKEDMLKRKFWRGLRNEELQNATRVHFESDISYEQLRKQVRSEEFEMKVQKERKDKKEKPPTNKAKQSALNFQDDEGKQMMKLLIEKMEQLDQKVNDLKKENEQLQKNRETPQRDKEGYRYNRGRGYNRGRWNRRGGRGQDTQQGQSSNENNKKPDKTAGLNEKGSS
ncbi:DNA ligase 1-like [Mercenaria mercenaria]|uniref:DNA ligase 1-like n=1 Tax=Mercenaria mercenaria TaxID=6596 RepID=UPI001E1D8546|nr:DNA ligase 1-like [Mercenaria mercenaria]